MISRNLLLLAITASSAVADKLSLYLGDGCRGARQGTFEPVEVGKCYEFGQSTSYFLSKDAGHVYELYSGNDCSDCRGRVVLSNACLTKGPSVHSIKKIASQNKLKIRGTTPALEKKGSELMLLGEGDAYQCPNIPSGADYFLLVTHTSAVRGEVGQSDEDMMCRDFMQEFSAAYQNPSGQTRVSRWIPYDGDNLDDVQMTLDMTNGVIQDFQERDMDSILDSVFDFRSEQQDPVNFFVSIYFGRIDNVGGVLAEFRFQGD